MPDCMFIGINPLYAVNTLAHLEASLAYGLGAEASHVSVTSSRVPSAPSAVVLSSTRLTSFSSV